MKLKNVSAGILAILFGACLIFYPAQVASAAQDALVLCIKTVIPSLFPFFVLSSFLVHIGLLSVFGNLIAPLAKLLFSISGSGAATFVVGLLCGSPTGAKTVAELYQKGLVEKKEANRLLVFCNNAGPLFVIGAVGSMMNDADSGKLLYLIHVLSAVVTGMLLSVGVSRRQKRTKNPVYAVNLAEAFTGAVTSSVTGILNVCGYIVLFSVAQAFILPILKHLLGENALTLFIGGLFEMTIGAKNICVAGLTEGATLTLLSGILGFGGLCIFFQVCGAVRGTDLSVGSYLLGKFIQAVVAMIITKGLLCVRDVSWVFPKAQGGSCVFLGVLGVFIICIIDKYFKNKYNRENRG